MHAAARDMHHFVLVLVDFHVALPVIIHAEDVHTPVILQYRSVIPPTRYLTHFIFTCIPTRIRMLNWTHICLVLIVVTLLVALPMIIVAEYIHTSVVVQQPRVVPTT